MVKRFIIRRQLATAIPSGIRSHFTMIMDPASGTVYVAVEKLSVDASSVLGYDRVSPDPAVQAAETLPSSSWTGFEHDPSVDGNSRKQREPFFWVHPKVSKSIELALLRHRGCLS